LRSKGMLNTIGAVVLLLSSYPLFPQEEEEAPPIGVYSLGQQSLSISAGLPIPLFFMAFDGTVSDSTNLSLGGAGSLQWGLHLDNHWLVGLEVGGSFNRSLRENILYMLPVTAKGAFIIHAYPFEFPVFLGTGLAVVKYTSLVDVNFVLKPGFSTIWKYNVSWGFGLNVVYWWILQPWAAVPEMGRMGNFLEVTATAQYHF